MANSSAERSFPKLLQVFIEIRKSERFEIETERHSTILEQVNMILSDKLPNLSQFLAQMEPLLDISKSHFCTKDIHQYHLSKDNIAALWIDYGNKIGVQFDNILVQMTIDRYCGSRIYHIEQAKSQPKEDIYRREFTSVELNAINYTAGYVIHKLLKKYSKGTKVTIVNCLMEMVEGGQLDLPSENESYHETVQLYQSKVNRGGLVAVSENVMNFFVTLNILPWILVRSSSHHQKTSSLMTDHKQ